MPHSRRASQRSQKKMADSGTCYRPSTGLFFLHCGVETIHRVPTLQFVTIIIPRTLLTLPTQNQRITLHSPSTCSTMHSPTQLTVSPVPTLPLSSQFPYFIPATIVGEHTFQ